MPIHLVQFGFCTNLVQFRFSSLNKLFARTVVSVVSCTIHFTSSWQRQREQRCQTVPRKPPSNPHIKCIFYTTQGDCGNLPQLVGQLRSSDTIRRIGRSPRRCWTVCALLGARLGLGGLAWSRSHSSRRLRWLSRLGPSGPPPPGILAARIRPLYAASSITSVWSLRFSAVRVEHAPAKSGTFVCSESRVVSWVTYPTTPALVPEPR